MSKLEQAIVQWENSLLDLGKRNRMINYPVAEGKRRSQQRLAIAEPGYHEVYDLLVRQGKSLTVQQPPVEKFDLRCEGVMRLFERLGSPVVPMQGDLRPEGSFPEYRKILGNMRAKMKLAREEQGIDILYLTVGFLDWKQLSGKQESLTSPLLLVPVRLKMKSIRAPHVLEMLDEDVVVNPALDQLFRMEYGLSLPELPDQDAPVDEYLDQVELLAKKHGWRVRREAHLALMSFQKLSMYHDLKRSHDRIAASDVLRAISGEAPYPLDASVMDGVSLDAIPPEDSHLVVNADSSQQYAVELSRRGVSFCLQGPPGGGKSQTITNIIAQALADGKKVLFVAEKMAALDVVHRRLKDAGLGEFTLAMHNHRADRRAILNEISHPLSLKKQELDHKAMATLDELEELRRSLNVYPVLLHRRREPLAESLYSVLGELAQLQEVPLVMAQLPGASNVTRADLTTETTRVARLARAYERYQTLPDNPWEGLQGMWTTFMARTQLQDEARAALEALQTLAPAAQALTAAGYLPADCTPASLEALALVCHTVRTQGTVPEELLSACGQVSALARQAQEAAAQHRRARDEAGEVLLPGAHLDADSLLTRMTALDSDLRAVITGVRYQSQTDAFQAHYAALVPSVQRMYDSALQALTLLNDPVMTGCEADWALDAAAALAGCPYLPQELAETAALESLCAQVKAVRQEAARLHQKMKELLINWTDEALRLDPAPYLRRFQNEYAGFTRMLNLAQYAQDMRALGSVYCGHARLDDTIARGFLTRLTTWQEEVRAWEKESRSVTAALGLPAMGVDGAWDAVENQLTALTALSRCADSPAHRRLLLAAMAQPDVRTHAARITEPLRFTMLDRSLRSADFLGDALADEIGMTLRSVRTACEDLTSLRDMVDQLRPACRDGATIPAMLSALRALDEAERSARAVAGFAGQLRPLLPGMPLHADTDFAALADRADRIAGAMEQHALLPADAARRLLTGALPLPAPAALECWTAAKEPVCAFASRFEGSAPLSDPLDALQTRLTRCLSEPDALDLWQEWRDMLSDMDGSLFAPFVPAARKANVPAPQWADAARRLFLYTWVEGVLDEEHLLALFRAHVHQERIGRFADLDQQQLHIARSRIRKQLIDLVPDEKHRALSASDELAVLQRELLKKRGHLPLRKLFAKIPNLLLTLKPCLMMSPLSVASFLESGEMTFDLVIFDEASQIMPENAIGAILRGRQVIVTGDTKQMPPTDFFTVSVGAHDYDSDEEEEAQEAPPEESILEQCACVLPSCPLLWHYRSRHESLIAFSNREIYAGRLVTFPGSIDRQPHLGVELVHVPDGVFSRRRNRQEAKRCVQLIEDHILHRAHRSLGVVAFSRTQQSAIEEELHRFRMARPEFDSFFDESRDEPFFIKNLENVQGDERDTMIFSVGYARPADGKPMSLNLGPLSASGGERRLNVAVTRARYNVKLVTSVLAGDIDLRRTASEGTRLLRAYIDYAEKGYAALEEPAAETAPACDAFVSRLSGVLAAAGLTVEQSVGCSDCRVDLAIRRPAPEGDPAGSSYALGVMTDGAAYAAQRTCRDRDSLQSSVLRGMGWRLHRVWSADWLQRPDSVERELLAAAQEALLAPDALPDEPDAPPEQTWSHPAAASDAPIAFAEYQQALLPEGTELPMNELILRIVETEQPVHRDEVCRRLAPALGLERVTPALRRDAEVAVARLLLDELREDDGFLSMAGFTLTHPRRAGSRPIDMISPEELRLALMLVAVHSIGAAPDSVIARVAELLGFERRGPRIQRTLESTLDALAADGQLTIADGKVLTAQEPSALPAADAPLGLPAPADTALIPTLPEVTDHD
ncbi:MAG: DUF3320 domain-containing protein [Clostridiales bacterium]|nr:DUF3320 domain-containing protein [Clostridiales bacterium]